jgi:hypothetical protein
MRLKELQEQLKREKQTVNDRASQIQLRKMAAAATKDSKKELQLQFEELRHKQKQLENYMNVLNATNATLKDTLSATLCNIEEGQAESSDSTINNRPGDDKLAREGAVKQKLVEYKLLVSELSTAIKNFSGVSIVDLTNESMTVKLSATHTLVLQFEDNFSTTLSGATLRPMDFPIDDLFRNAVKDNDLASLISETRSRLINYSSRRDELQQLRARVVINMTSIHSDTVQITTKSGLLLKLYLSPDYPEVKSLFFCVSLLIFIKTITFYAWNRLDTCQA